MNLQVRIIDDPLIVGLLRLGNDARHERPKVFWPLRFDLVDEEPAGVVGNLRITRRQQHLEKVLAANALEKDLVTAELNHKQKQNAGDPSVL